MKAVIFISLFTAGLAIIISMIRSKRFFTALFLSSLQGICVLFAADLIGSFAGINLPVNAYTVIFCAVGGIPAVIFLLIADVFLR